MYEEQHLYMSMSNYISLYQKTLQSLLLNFPLKLKNPHSVLALLIPIDEEGREGENRHPHTP